MKGPRFPVRLMESAGDDLLLRDLLGAARAETMDPSRAASVLDACATTRGTGEGTPSAGHGKAISARRSSVLLRLGAPVAMVCAVGLGWRMLGSSPPPAPAPPPRTEVGQRSDVDPPPPPPDVSSSTRVEDLPPASGVVDVQHASAPEAPRAPSSRAARAPRIAASAAHAASRFHEELALVESARAALATADLASCLAITERYDQTFRGGVFADEIVVMRIEALARAGDHVRARELGGAFVRNDPGTAYADRIRSVLSATASGSGGNPR